MGRRERAAEKIETTVVLDNGDGDGGGGSV